MLRGSISGLEVCIPSPSLSLSLSLVGISCTYDSLQRSGNPCDEERLKNDEKSQYLGFCTEERASVSQRTKIMASTQPEGSAPTVTSLADWQHPQLENSSSKEADRSNVKKRKGGESGTINGNSGVGNEKKGKGEASSRPAKKRMKMTRRKVESNNLFFNEDEEDMQHLEQQDFRSTSSVAFTESKSRPDQQGTSRRTTMAMAASPDDFNMGGTNTSQPTFEKDNAAGLYEDSPLDTLFEGKNSNDEETIFLNFITKTHGSQESIPPLGTPRQVMTSLEFTFSPPSSRIPVQHTESDQSIGINEMMNYTRGSPPNLFQRISQ